MRKSNIDALLSKAQDQLKAIRAEYDRSLHAQQIEPALKIDIKNLCENLRSALDYIAHDIREKHCSAANPKDRFYFPILPDAQTFAKQATQWFPGLTGTCPALLTLLESIQPYQPGYEWLGRFNRLNNENKHGNLVEQTRKETHRITASTPGVTVSWDPASVRFGAGVFIGGVPVNPATQIPVPHPSQTVERTIWVDFQFADIGVSALSLLSDSVTGITDLTKRIYAAI
jgi:hypothetical protein